MIFKGFTVRVSNLFTIRNLFALLAITSFAYCTYLALVYANQAPLDIHKFRQTQTAITAYWFIHDGFRLAYETPVAGPPWSIPFEFPIYQFIVAEISRLSAIPLNAAGRITSYFFLLLCLIPIKSIILRLRLPESVFYIFCALLFTAPTYVYWGRSFMIETTALFFTITAIKYFIDYLLYQNSYKHLALFVLFISLSILQKSTTALPVLPILFLLFLLYESGKTTPYKKLIFSKKFLTVILCFSIPLIIGISWVNYTDNIKQLNALGSELTSSALTKWNWGNLSQRFSPVLYEKVFWDRMLATNLGGIISLVLISLAFLVKSEHRLKIIILASLGLFLLPPLLFTNLYINHLYYPTVNVIYAIFAISVVLGAVLTSSNISRTFSFVALLLVLFVNHLILEKNYVPLIKHVFSKNSRTMAVGLVLKRELDHHEQFVAFGYNWNSGMGYISERKSFTVPEWIKNYNVILENPENYVDKGSLGAVVSCSNKTNDKNTYHLTLTSMDKWVTNNRMWKIGETAGCYIATPEKLFNKHISGTTECDGDIQPTKVVDKSGHIFLNFSGWVLPSNRTKHLYDEVFISITPKDNQPAYLQALIVPEPGVNKTFHIPDTLDTGFSRMIPASSLKSGEYMLNILLTQKNKSNLCNLKVNLILE